MKSFETMLSDYAKLAVKVGVNLKEKESLLITGNESTLPLVRKITQEAYKAGAKDVEFMLVDDGMTLARYAYGKDYVFEAYPQWKIDAITAMYEAGYQHMAVVASNPDLLKDVDAQLVGKDTKMKAEATHPLMLIRMSGAVKWNIVAMPSKDWAKKVFPELETEKAIERLWESIFAATRVDQDNPVEAWRLHNEALKKKEAFLNMKAFEKLIYKAPGTDLEVYLGIDHEWAGGASESNTQVPFMPNIPTEEVFTAPHCKKVNGTLRATKPLAYQGKVIDEFGFTFKEGRIIDFYAGKGYEVLENLLNTDEGARYLGEVALVAYDSPISNTGILFSNTLFDENASCHFAVGMAYPKTFKNGQDETKEALEARGANYSNTHVDFMVGCKELKITGVTKSGETFELFKNGNWTF